MQSISRSQILIELIEKCCDITDPKGWCEPKDESDEQEEGISRVRRPEFDDRATDSKVSKFKYGAGNPEGPVHAGRSGYLEIGLPRPKSL